MKIRSLILASAIVLTAAGAALAQSNTTANPTAQAGSKAPDSTMTNGTMSKDTMANDKMKSTTGMTTKDTSEKAASPAAPDAGVKQEK